MYHMDRNKEVTFKCPVCDTEMVIEPKEHSDTEHGQMGEDHTNLNKNKVVKQSNAATMPMDQFRNKLSSVPGMPQNPKVPPNLSSY